MAVVTTARGRVALVSDLGDHYRCWHPADPRASSTPMRFLAGSFLPGAIRSGERAHLRREHGACAGGFRYRRTRTISDPEGYRATGSMFLRLDRGKI